MASGGTGVNVPVNQAIKEKDVNSKLQLFGIYAAFANGKVPSVSASKTSHSEPSLTKSAEQANRRGDELCARVAADAEPV
jgi:hypothetical protein